MDVCVKPQANTEATPVYQRGWQNFDASAICLPPLSESVHGKVNNTGTFDSYKINDWLEMMESGIEAAAVFFDFAKAFYSCHTNL